MTSKGPLFDVPKDEPLADRCLRLAGEIRAYEQDIAGDRGSLNLSEIRSALEEAGAGLR